MDNICQYRHDLFKKKKWFGAVSLGHRQRESTLRPSDSVTPQFGPLKRVLIRTFGRVSFRYASKEAAKADRKWPVRAGESHPTQRKDALAMFSHCLRVCQQAVAQ